MVALAMAFAAFWGVLQLAVLGWGARSVRVGTLVLALGAGFYACGALAIGLELAWTRLAAAVGGGSVADAVRQSGYTASPVVEELVKVLPLVVAGLHLRTRRQWGLTDHLLVGAAAGAGFGLLEAVLRLGHQPGFADPFVPGIATTLGAWLPAPADVGLLGAPGPGAATDAHLVWSALAGLGVGIWFRLRGHARWAGPALVLLAIADHAAANYDAATRGGSGVGEVLAAPFVAARPVLWLWPLLALAAAVVLDVRALRRARAVVPSPALRREADGGRRGLVRYALLGLPWTASLVLRFVAIRRAALYACDSGTSGAHGPGEAGAGDAGDAGDAADAGGAGARGVPDDARPMLGEVADVRSRMDVADGKPAWNGVGLRRVTLMRDPGPDRAGGPAGGTAHVLRRYWPLAVWGLLLVPPFLYYLVGTSQADAGLQSWLERPGAFGALFVVPGGFGLVLLAWQIVTGLHGLPAALRAAPGEAPVVVGLRTAVALAASLAGVLGIAGWLTGTHPSRPLVNAFHAVEAFDALLLAATPALMLAAFVLLPPALGLSLVAPDPASPRLVPGVALTPGTPTLLGTGGVMLAQAVANSGGDPWLPVPGRGSVPDAAREPAPPEPPVHHPRLRRIVDDLWAGTANPARVGDGTTMAAVRNEVRTGRPTHGRFHLGKAREAGMRLLAWTDEFGNASSRVDRSWAWQLHGALERALDADGGPDRAAVDAFVDRLVVALPALSAEYEQISRECAEDGLGPVAGEVFLDEHTRALRYRFRDGVIEARAELEALAAEIEKGYGGHPDVDRVVDVCFLALLSAEGTGPDPRDVLGPRLSAVVGDRRDRRADPAATAFAGRVTAAVPALGPLAAANRYGDAGDVLLHGFLADVAARVSEQFRTGGPNAVEEAGVVVGVLETELGTARVVDEAIAVSFVENLPHPGTPGAEMVEALGPRLRSELDRQRPADPADPAG